ncbi:Alkyl hydroperoxide reductase thiol specific antioxidant mal allergen [Colletotrichum higginsianum IMI 349063]|uniref:Alkyl hydroperoxide reductase thiol specific antioxidant mal allergen n=1 Tax=Colletotrichum higginsianum (strain IMI 349063) TaxID=759273 RepID=A0A1B7YG56_COLHI|nr:Alkyl hydroperoxide reductase thiol specific antioxidant mal allergen [Colletotrichum higginsianum IMI 349063]OBR10930.1 Alkyl hydroperoxide reductase thiol specific antioxidant mal allergen [Colletotrichum higginsianum IMI 349063]
MSFVTRPPILRRSPAEANGLVRKFLHNCLDHHESCRLGQPEEEFELPSRVLSIKDEAGGISVKLVENDGLSGRYCALSHCWGPEDKRPLRTLHGNITDHLASIPWNKLPATFQDAITLTIGLGIEYLWIDSLCIVQDDKKDWFHESKKMASVYRRATLVIAAVSSEDSTQGLSKPERPEPLTFSVPFYTQEGSPQSGYNIAEFQNPWGGIDGPLRERAWAFQEWYLGRRKVFFTSEGINWKCDEIECNERGSDTDLRLYETDSWANCLQEYTNKLLTVPSDRLVALLGISAEMQKSRTDSFVPEFGVWEDNLSEQLLWRPTDMMHENLPGLPSWCWAATGGAKAWLVDEQDRIVPNEVMVKSTVNTISLRKSGHPDFGNNPSSSEEDWSTDTKDSGSAFEESGVGYYGGSDDDSFIEESEDSYPGHTHRNTDACVDLYKVGRSKEVHWALLLQPVDNTLKKFTRVGVALLWPRALETGEGEVTEFEIV